MPINLIVIIAIAVLVLVVLAAFFTGAIGGGTNSIALNTALDSACQKWRSIYNCAIGSIGTATAPYKMPGTTTEAPIPLTTLCQQAGLNTVINADGIVECAARCGCPSS